MEPSKQLRAFRDEYLGVDSADLEMMDGEVTLGELSLGGDGLVFALFLGGDAQIIPLSPWNEVNSMLLESRILSKFEFACHTRVNLPKPRFHGTGI
jgi:hypothetical protein